MRALKSIVRGFFAIQAAVFLLLVVGAIMGGLRSHLGVFLAHSAWSEAYHQGAQIFACAIVAGILAVGLLFAMAWWTTRKPKPENRVWAIAASVANMGQGILFLLASHLTKGRLSFSPGDGLWFIGIGATGIFLFARSTEAAVPTVVVERKSVAGDRTRDLTRHTVTVLSCIAQIAAVILWSRWAFTRELARAYGLTWIALVAVASVLTTLIHECGHALIAWCFEMNLLSFKAGPFQWVKREGKWTFKLHLGGLLTPGGAVSAVSKDPSQPRWEEILMIAAGPLMNLLFGIPALYAVLRDDWPHYQQTWELVAFTASFCVIAAILNLVPFLSDEGAYSDGARILQIVTKSPLEEYHRAMASIASTATTERRYRDLDVTAIQRAASLFPDEFRGLHLNLCACHCFEDRSCFPEAAAALASAEAIYDQFAIDLPASLHTVFVIGHAYLNRDAAAARVWWDRMEAKGNERQNMDYWLARTALLWIEGDTKGAEDAWFKADMLAQALPKFGAYEFDRFRCFLLRQALNEQTAVAETIEAPSAAAPVLPLVAKEDASAWSPILPAWITMPQTAAIEAAPAAAIATDPITRIVPPPNKALTPANGTNSYGDTASMFARLSSLTAGSAEVSPATADLSPEPLAKCTPAVEGVKVEAELPVATNKLKPMARIVSAGSGKGAIDGANAADNDPFARILPPATRSLSDVLASATEKAPAASARWSARPSAPPLVGAPSITPLPVNAWTPLPLLDSTPDPVTSFLPSPVQVASQGTSVPAAFARKPRMIAPMPEVPFGAPAAEAMIEPNLSAEPSAEPAEVLTSTVEYPAVLPEWISHHAAMTPPQTVGPTAVSSVAIASAEVAPDPPEAAPQATPVSDAVEAPRFDPLAFIRAAAIKNLSA
jgi:hypothetical protein